MPKLVGWKTAFVVCLFAAVSAFTAYGQVLTTLLSFDGNDGAGPQGTLVQAVDGGLYGTTGAGGDINCEPPPYFGCGEVFKITTPGADTVVYGFTKFTGMGPSGVLTQGTDGNFYGTTVDGGGFQACNGGNATCGTVFSVSPSGNINFSFTFGYGDGAYPLGGVVEGSDGNFYGTTSAGGTGGWGTVFRITPQGVLSTLYNFCSQTGCTDGAAPTAGLVQATDGNFYGTTTTGGANGRGTVFEITAESTLTTLYSFSYTSSPNGLIEGADGNLYGTTAGGGVRCGNEDDECGSVFRVTKKGALTTLYTFCTQGGEACEDGEQPQSGLLQATDGSLYGTTYYGGGHGRGTIFSITPTGTLTTLYNFCSLPMCADGSSSVAGLIQGTDGKLYGTTSLGGTETTNCNQGCGTAFTLSTGLGPFVAFIRAAGRVGQAVGVLGQGFSGATGVSFNGAPATFNVRRGTFLTTAVPTGATTGYVTVTIPSGTLTSNVPFQVLP